MEQIKKVIEGKNLGSIISINLAVASKEFYSEANAMLLEAGFERIAIENKLHLYVYGN